MKKFFAVLLCTVMAASATACANSSAGNSESSKAESAVSQASEEETSAPETTKEESSKAESSTSIMFGNIQEYLEYPSTQKYLESAKSANLFTVECYADDDTLVYEYKYTKQLPDDSIDQVVEYFKKITETLESGMVPVMKDLVAYVDETDPKIKVVYLNADGSELYSITFDKSILDEESTDESSSAEL